MVLYIEYVIFDNLIMDSLIFYLMSFTFKYKFNKIRLMIAIILGVFCAIFMPFLIEYEVIMFLYKIVFSVLIVLTLRKYNNKKKFILYFMAFWLYTFILGGVILGILQLFGISYNVSGLIMYNCNIPMGAILLLGIITIWLLKNIIVAIKNQIKTSNYLYKIKLIDGKKEVIATGFLDSGNKVMLDGKGVNIISINLFQKLHREIGVDRILLGRIDEKKLKNMSYINITGISSVEKYLAFTIDKMIVENEIFENVNIAVALKNFDDFDCILSDSFVGGL